MQLHELGDKVLCHFGGKSRALVSLLEASSSLIRQLQHEHGTCCPICTYVKSINGGLPRESLCSTEEIPSCLSAEEKVVITKMVALN